MFVACTDKISSMAQHPEQCSQPVDSFRFHLCPEQGVVWLRLIRHVYHLINFSTPSVPLVPNFNTSTISYGVHVNIPVSKGPQGKPFSLEGLLKELDIEPGVVTP